MYRLRARLRVGLSGCFALTPCLHTLSPHFVSTLCRIRFVPTLCLHTLSPHFVGYASSPHFVSTLCRIRFVPTLCPYALSLRCHAFVPAFRSLLKRLGARGLCGVLASAWIENGTAGDTPSPRLRSTGRRAPRFGFPFAFRCALEPVVSAVYWGAHGVANGPAGDVGLHVSAFPFASDAPWSPPSPRFCGNFSRHSPPIDPRKPPSRLVNDSIGTAYCHCLLSLPVPCLLPHVPCLHPRFMCISCNKRSGRGKRLLARR